MKKLLPCLVVLAFIVVLAPSAAQDGYKVIVHRDSAVASLSKDDASDMLLKKKSRWDDGSPVVSVDLDAKSEVRATMSRDLHGRSVSSIKNYWQRQIFSGREVPPTELPDDRAVIAFVASNPGAIGYVSSGVALTSDVKTVTITE